MTFQVRKQGPILCKDLQPPQLPEQPTMRLAWLGILFVSDLTSLSRDGFTPNTSYTEKQA